MLMEQLAVLQAQVNRLEKHAADGATGSAAAPEPLMLPGPGLVPGADLGSKQREEVSEGDVQSTTESESEDAQVDQQQEQELETEIHQELERSHTACAQKEPCALPNQEGVGEANHGCGPAADPPKMDEEPWSPPSPSDVPMGPNVEDLDFTLPPTPKPSLLCPGYRSSGLLRVHFEEEPLATIEVPQQPLEEWWTHPRGGKVQCALCQLLVLESDTFVTELYESELPQPSGLLQSSYNDLVCSQCLKDHMIPPERVSNTPGRGSIGWLKVDNSLSSPRNDVETSSPAAAADVKKDIGVQSDGGSTETEMDSDEEQQRRAQVLLDSL